MSEPTPYNQLLYWLSAAGQGSYDQFKQVCAQLGIQEKAYKVRRNLQLLGHIEVQPGARKWSIAPAAWVQSPRMSESEPTRWFLCGQRSAAWAEHPELQQQPQSDGPDCWWAETPCELSRLQPEQAGCTSEKLLHILVPMARWVDELVPMPLQHHPRLYNIKRWNAQQEAFVSWPRTDFELGIYQFERNVGRYDARLMLYYKPDQPKGKEWLVADFTGLRFANEYHQAEQELIFCYNRQSGELWVPAQQR